jgi:serine/threonine protein kinase
MPRIELYAVSSTDRFRSKVRRPVRFGKYLLLDRISVGGMAEVFKAKSFGIEGFEKIVAIKRILPSMGEDRDFIRMFIDEANIAGQLSHANICQIFELGRIETSHFIAMEYLWGKDLLQIQNRFRRSKAEMPLPMAYYIVAKVCEGLDYAHRKKDAFGQPMNIVHRDCSPQNVLVSYEGEVKLIDFGIAKAASRSSKTVAGVLKGKFGYMSPEQVRGMALDRRSDIFAVGTVLYECVTGQRLFQSESDFSTLEKVRSVSILPPSHFNANIPEELERIIMKALQREPGDRYQWASELRADLQQLLMAEKKVFTAKALSEWLKQEFASELKREQALLERYDRLAKAMQEEMAGRSNGAKSPSTRERPAGMAGLAAADSGEFEEGPTEIFGELETKPPHEVAALPLASDDIEDAETTSKPAPSSGPRPAPAMASPIVAPELRIGEPEPSEVTTPEPSVLAPPDSAELPEPSITEAGNREVPIAARDANGAIAAKPASAGLSATYRPRTGLMRDVALGLGIAALILTIVTATRLLFFAGDERAAAGARGTIAVAATDNGPGSVFINGLSVGELPSNEPLTLQRLLPGTYHVVVRRPGAADCVRPIDLEPDRVTVVTCNFARPEAPPARFILRGDLSDAVVFVDEQEVSAQSAREPMLLRPSVNHTVRVRRPGMLDQVFTVFLLPGQEIVRTLAAESAQAPTVASPINARPVRPRRRAPVRQAPAKMPEGPPAAPPATKPGYLVARTTPWARVFIDGKDTGLTTPIAEQAKIALAPGKHRVTFVVGARRFSYPVVIESGTTINLRKALPMEADD